MHTWVHFLDLTSRKDVEKDNNLVTVIESNIHMFVLNTDLCCTQFCRHLLNSVHENFNESEGGEIKIIITCFLLSV